MAYTHQERGSASVSAHCPVPSGSDAESSQRRREHAAALWIPNFINTMLSIIFVDLYVFVCLFTVFVYVYLECGIQAN